MISPSRVVKFCASGAAIVFVSLMFTSPAMSAAGPYEYWKLPLPMDGERYPQWTLSSDEGLNIEKLSAEKLGEGSIVSVVDTGVNPHREFRDRVLPGFDFISDHLVAGDGDVRDPDFSDPGVSESDPTCRDEFGATAPSSWHGTYVAGIIGASADGTGVSGVAPGAKILPVRASGNCAGSSADVADAILWSSGEDIEGVPTNVHAADVISVSLSELGVCDAQIDHAISIAEGNGSIVVLSAGNDAVPASLSSPSNCSGGLSVGASDRNGDIAYYSNWGRAVDVWAPGGDVRYEVHGGVLSTIDLSSGLWGSDDGYGYYQGTSAAAPHIAGIVAIMRSVGFSGNSSHALDVLQSCAREIGASASPRSVPVVDGDCVIGAVQK